MGPALETLPILAGENPAPFDLIFIDADDRTAIDERDGSGFCSGSAYGRFTGARRFQVMWCGQAVGDNG